MCCIVMYMYIHIMAKTHRKRHGPSKKVYPMKISTFLSGSNITPLVMPPRYYQDYHAYIADTFPQHLLVLQ